MQPRAFTFILIEHFCSHSGLETTRGQSPSRTQSQHRLCSLNCWSWGAHSPLRSSANPNGQSPIAPHRFLSPHHQPKSQQHPRGTGGMGWDGGRTGTGSSVCSRPPSNIALQPSPLHPIRGRGCARSLLLQLERGCASRRSYLLLFNEESGCPGAGSPWKLGFFRHSMEDAGTERFVQEY